MHAEQLEGGPSQFGGGVGVVGEELAGGGVGAGPLSGVPAFAGIALRIELVEADSPFVDERVPGWGVGRGRDGPRVGEFWVSVWQGRGFWLGGELGASL